MAELTCPLCSHAVQIPRAEPHKTYSCPKCHTPFHLSKTHRVVVGDPPDVEEELQQLRQQVREKLTQLPTGRIIAGVATLLVVFLGLYYLLRPAEDLAGPAQEAAQAIADGDLDALQALAAPGTAEDLARWYERVHPLLLRARESWHGRDEDATANVAQENPEAGTGATVASVHPAALGSTRDISLADPAAATASAPTPFETSLAWTLNRWGRWQIDGSATLALTPPPEQETTPLPAEATPAP